MKRLLVLLALVAACKKSAAPEGPGNGGGGGGSFDERQACTVDSDCVAVELECCDQCNGGHAVGIHKDYAQEVRSTYVTADECKDTACTLMACPAPRPICRNQICGLVIGDREQVDALPPP